MDLQSTVGEDLSRQVSLAAELLEHQRLHHAGAALSAIRVNDKILKEKERVLVESIAQNYSRIKGVEKELAGLQLQLRLTSGPKKSALELLRRKIEAQTDQVVAARQSFRAARKVMEAQEAVLKAEEAAKDQLCQELNLLVQQSAQAQLERLEQLTHRMELLNQGFVPPLDAPLPPTVSSGQTGMGPAPYATLAPAAPAYADMQESKEVSLAATSGREEGRSTASPVSASPEPAKVARRTDARKPVAAKARSLGNAPRQPEEIPGKLLEAGLSRQPAAFQGFDS